VHGTSGHGWLGQLSDGSAPETVGGWGVRLPRPPRHAPPPAGCRPTGRAASGDTRRSTAGRRKAPARLHAWRRHHLCARACRASTTDAARWHRGAHTPAHQPPAAPRWLQGPPALSRRGVVASPAPPPPCPRPPGHRPEARMPTPSAGGGHRRPPAPRSPRGRGHWPRRPGPASVGPAGAWSHRAGPGASPPRAARLRREHAALAGLDAASRAAVLVGHAPRGRPLLKNAAFVMPQHRRSRHPLKHAAIRAGRRTASPPRCARPGATRLAARPGCAALEASPPWPAWLASSGAAGRGLSVDSWRWRRGPSPARRPAPCDPGQTTTPPVVLGWPGAAIASLSPATSGLKG
jgi:hypothetical protein